MKNFFLNGVNVTYFDSFRIEGIEHIPEFIRKFTENKNIIKNICRRQAYKSIICSYFCIGFIDFKLKGESLLDYTNLFSPNKHEKNDKIILIVFLKLKEVKMILYITLSVKNIENLRILKYPIFTTKH